MLQAPPPLALFRNDRLASASVCVFIHKAGLRISGGCGPRFGSSSSRGGATDTLTATAISAVLPAHLQHLCHTDTQIQEVGSQQTLRSFFVSPHEILSPPGRYLHFCFLAVIVSTCTLGLKLRALEPGSRNLPLLSSQRPDGMFMMKRTTCRCIPGSAGLCQKQDLFALARFPVWILLQRC